MYDRDPRREWSASLAHHFPHTAGRPADLMKLTPPELDHLLAVHKKTIQAVKG